MEDFDLLYLLKTPFFMGNFQKVQNEYKNLEINSEDHKNLSLRNLLLVRTLTAKGDILQLKQFMQDLL